MNEPSEDLPEPIKRVIQRLRSEGKTVLLRTFQAPAKRASQAAELLGCSLGAVVKSIVFQMDEVTPVLVLVSGDNRADLAVLTEILGQPVRQASPAFVRQATGYSVGAVPPFGIKTKLQVIIDRTLMDFENVWASAGSAHTLMRLSPAVLAAQTQGIIKKIN
jgi:Cys-tRNA(Pro) deacylase